MKMKNLLFAWTLLLAFAACTNEEEPPTPPAPAEEGFEITVHEESLTAYSVSFDIRPKKSNATYYYDVISKARWEESDLATMQAEIEEAIHSLADMTSTPYEETLAGMLFRGDQLNIYSGAGYRANTDFYIYAYYWDGSGPSPEVTLCAFTTPAPQPSSEQVEISFEEVGPYSMTVTCEPSLGIADYYLYFDEVAKVEAATADQEAFLSYQAMNVGLHYADLQSLQQQGLKPKTEYAVAVMAIDEKGNRFMTCAEQATTSTEETERVESMLFSTLLGEWDGRQTISDGFSDPEESTFTVTIVQEVEDHNFDYRAKNQLVALVDGWCRIPYYGVKGLEESYAGMEDVPNPTEAFGPKWLLNIGEGDVVTIDGQARHSVIGWMFMGDCYMVSGSVDGALVLTSHDLVVEVSSDKNTLRITTPAELSSTYPSLAYQFPGFGWMAYSYGISDIVLTKRNNIAANN